MDNRITVVKEKYAAWIEKNKKLFLDLVGNPYMIDTQYKYLDWLIYTFQQKRVDMPLDDIINQIKKFDEVCSQLDRKSLYSYKDIYDVQTCVVAFQNREAKKEAQELEFEKNKKLAAEEVEEPVYYTFNEFLDLLYQKIVETYPKSFKAKDKIIDGKYETDVEGHIRLFYEVPYFNTMLHVALHLFDADSPITIQSQDLTSSQEHKKQTFRISFGSSSFKNRSLCFDLLDKSKNGPEMCVKFIEFTIASFIDSVEFQQTFSAEYVFWKGGQRGPDESVKKILEYIKDKQEAGTLATKYDYVVNFMERPLANVRSFQHRTFVDLKKANVIDIDYTDDGYSYILGPNYTPFIEGRLKHV
jgi:hypothetical protein